MSEWTKNRYHLWVWNMCDVIRGATVINSMDESSESNFLRFFSFLVSVLFFFFFSFLSSKMPLDLHKMPNGFGWCIPLKRTSNRMYGSLMIEIQSILRWFFYCNLFSTMTFWTMFPFFLLSIPKFSSLSITYFIHLYFSFRSLTDVNRWNPFFPFQSEIYSVMTIELIAWMRTNLGVYFTKNLKCVEWLNQMK